MISHHLGINCGSNNPERNVKIEINKLGDIIEIKITQMHFYKIWLE